jgi:hypothetical protein
METKLKPPGLVSEPSKQAPTNSKQAMPKYFNAFLVKETKLIDWLDRLVILHLSSHFPTSLT